MNEVVKSVGNCAIIKANSTNHRFVEKYLLLKVDKLNFKNRHVRSSIQKSSRTCLPV